MHGLLTRQGVTVASVYPGTPSTEILENITQYERIDASWAPNEKVALEVGIGASMGGAITIVTMKHVGVNVAADPLFTFPWSRDQVQSLSITCRLLFLQSL